MTLVNRLAKYYKYCLYEEAKISAFSNLHKEDNIVVKLNGYEKIFHNFPTPYTAQEESVSLTQLMLKSTMDKKKQLLYGYLFITGELEDGTQIYTPLIYADCNLERINGKLAVSIASDTVSFNVPVLVQLVNTDEDRDMLIKELSNYDLTQLLPLTEGGVAGIEKLLSDFIPNLDTVGQKKELSGNEYKVHLNRENAVILTTINKGLAGVINELDRISKEEAYKINSSSLVVINDDNGENKADDNREYFAGLDRFLPAFTLDDSQKEVAQVASKDIITSITGGPGTGKTNTIAAIATNYILNGKSVLICSKQNSAVDVVYNKLSSLTKLPYVVRTGGKEYRKELAELLDKITTNRFNVNIDDFKSMEYFIDSVNKEHDKFIKYEAIGNDIDSKSRELTSLRANSANAKNFIDRFFKDLKVKKCQNELDLIYQERKSIDLLKSNQYLDLKRRALAYTVKGSMLFVTQSNTIRRELTVLAKALKKGQVDKLDYESIFETLVNEVLPCWCTTTVDVSNSIPLINGLFDVVIIDEASQCDIASCLPLLYRAKHAVVVGDDKQLKYLSFLSNAVNNANIESNDLGKYSFVCNYRENSMFDFANYFSNGNVMLKTQYRGCSQIMDFSNAKFYNHNIVNVGKSEFSNPVRVNQVNGDVRVGKAVNDKEISAIIETIKDIISTDKIENIGYTIGVLSPFREQCKQIEKVISSVFTLEEIEKYKILVGTAHSFQGEERDIMLISWTVADNSPFQSYTFINNPNLFNVSITRARKQVINFISATELPKGLLKEYIEYCKKVK